MAKAKYVADPEREAANELTYKGETLATSEFFNEDMWLAYTILDHDKYYTVSQARAIVSREKERRV